MLCRAVQDLSAAWADYTATYNKLDETKRAVRVLLGVTQMAHTWGSAESLVCLLHSGRAPVYTATENSMVLHSNQHGAPLKSMLLLLLQAAAQIEKLRGNHKRKLSELQASLQSRLADTDQKLAKIDSKSGRAKGIGGILQQFMAAPAE